MRLPHLFAAILALTAQAAGAQTPVFDLHVHLWKGEESLRAYERQLKEQRQEVAGFGAMWFGGPNHAAAGKPERVRDGNDGIIALAAKHPRLLPIATIHPYDGPAALAELERIAGKG